MVDLPFIALPVPTNVRRVSAGGGRFPRSQVQTPGRARQGQRLGGRFARLSERLATPEGLAELREDPASIAPERAVVFELADLPDAKKVYRALDALGFELLDEDETKAVDADFPLKPTPSGQDRAGKPAVRQLYFAMPGERQLRSLVALWRRYERGEALEHGLTAWRDLFDHLSDIRPWGPRDRLSDATCAALAEDLAAFPDQPRRVEIELWYRTQCADRISAARKLRQRIADLGGTVVDEREIPDIVYHAMLVELPAHAMARLVAERERGLVLVNEIMLILQQTRSPIVIEELELAPALLHQRLVPVEGRPPIIALFDGMPLMGHRALTGRVLLDDPEGHDARYEAHQRQHGTEMASIILHGDANAPSPLPHQLYVRPVLVPDEWHERFPENELAVYAIYRALQRMLVGEAGPPAVAPSAPDVRIVNLSLGEPKRRFAGMVSPWARLLDRFAFAYRLLILVSAGNIWEGLPVPGVLTAIELEDMEATERTSLVLSAVMAEKARRTLLSPAEAVNVLTVGARHRDAVFNGAMGPMSFDPYHVDTLPNVTSGLGTGAARAAKPDILMDGGRELVRARVVDGVVTIQPPGFAGPFFGIRAATAQRAGGIEGYRNVFGTSAATALATHEAARLEAALRAMEGIAVPDEQLAVVLKALLGHAAAWDEDAGALVDGLAREAGIEAWQHRRVEQSRLLGLGSADLGRVLTATQQRAVLLFSGEIERDRTHQHPLPLPSTLSGRGEWRAMTATLAWLTPVSFRHRGYRAAALSLDLEGFDGGRMIGATAEPWQPDENLAARGTLLHRRWSGEDPAVFMADQGVRLDVSCASPTDALELSVPYALAVTIEVGVASEIDVYTEIRTRIGTPIRLRIDGAGR
jgi:hypothetical protein